MRRIACETCGTRTHGCIVGNLPVAALPQFEAQGTVAVYRPRQVIFHEGTPAAGLYVLCHGAVKLYQSDRFGRDHIVGIAAPGDVLGEVPAEDGATYSLSAEALVESQARYVPREHLQDIIALDPATGMRLVAALSSALAAARRKIRDLALKGAETRLAGLLLEIVPAETANGSPARRYSRREIAEMIGVSPETAIRLLGRLKRRGLIAIDGRAIAITDAEGLHRVAERYDA